MSVFNERNTGHITGEYPLFLGEERGLYDNVHVNHQRLFDLYLKLKAIDWQHDEIPLDQTKLDLMSVDEGTRDMMLLNLAYQWRADSAIGNSLATLLQPFISNSEYAHVISRIAENENLHSLTYSNIVRQSLKDPKEVFDRVYKTEEVLGRLSSAFTALEELDKVGCMYKLGFMDSGEVKKPLFKGVVAIFILERISFMNSFAATFALGSQNLFVGAARYVQKICQDEMIHFEVARYVVKDMLKDPRFKEDIKECWTDVVNMVKESRLQERKFNEFMFQDGRYITGLNLDKVNQWTDFNVQNVCDTLGIETPFERLSDPLPWIATDWVDINSHQNASMESPGSNYALNNVINDDDELDLDDMEI